MQFVTITPCFYNLFVHTASIDISEHKDAPKEIEDHDRQKRKTFTRAEVAEVIFTVLWNTCVDLVDCQLRIDVKGFINGPIILSLISLFNNAHRIYMVACFHFQLLDNFGRTRNGVKGI